MLKKALVTFALVIFIGMIWIFYQAFWSQERQVKSDEKLLYGGYEKNPSIAFPSLELLQNGDIIFRRGYGVDSTVSMNFSQGEKRYSHAGIVYKTDKGVSIIHAEEDKIHGYNGVYQESITDFLDGISIWAIYRFDQISKENQEKIVQYALELSQKNIEFDIDFNLKDDDKMYCSEFIYKVVNRSTTQTLIKPGKKFLGKSFVTISDLYKKNVNTLIQSSHKKLTKL